jgi:hypothetical protein
MTLPIESRLTVNSYFDVTWEGPVLDASGKQTSTVKGK